MNELEVVQLLEESIGKRSAKWGFKELGEAGILLGVKSLALATETLEVQKAILEELKKRPAGYPLTFAPNSTYFPAFGPSTYAVSK